MYNFPFIENNKACLLLQKILESQRLAHAYLFYGEGGLGKYTLAKQFAQNVFCNSNQEKPCGRCSHCFKIQKNMHPDLIEIGAHDSEQILSVEEIRKVKRQASKKPNEALYQIFIVHHAQRLSPSAANAFLKILEDPPETVIFLLLADHKNNVLPTIMSRCVLIPLLPVSDNSCLHKISAMSGETEKQKLLEITALSGGNIGKALFLLQKPLGQRAFFISRELISAIFSETPIFWMSKLAPLENNQDLCKYTMQCLYDWIHCILKRSNHFAPFPLPISFREGRAAEMLAAIQKVLTAMEKNANRRLLLTWFCTNIDEGVKKGGA